MNRFKTRFADSITDEEHEFGIMVLGPTDSEYRDSVLDLLNRKDEPTLPIETYVDSCFIMTIEGRDGVYLGNIFSMPCPSGSGEVLSVGITGFAREQTKLPSLFDCIERRVGNGKITAFDYIGKNPLNLPEWNPIPEPPECKIYRFQYHRTIDKYSSWNEGIVRIALNRFKMIAYETQKDFSNPGLFWGYWKNKGISKFEFIDKCDELGEWPGNKGGG